MARASRELRAIRRAQERARETKRSYMVYVGYVIKPGRRPRLHVRSGWDTRVKGGELVAWCSPTGMVRLSGSWVGRVQVTSHVHAHA